MLQDTLVIIVLAIVLAVIVAVVLVVTVMVAVISGKIKDEVIRVSYLYRVIHKSLRDFRTRLRNNQDRHGRKEHINR